MTRAGMDYKNPEGVKAYVVFKDLCIVERNKSEGSRVPEKPSPLNLNLDLQNPNLNLSTKLKA